VLSALNERFDYVGDAKIDDRNRISLGKALDYMKNGLGTAGELKVAIYKNEFGHILLAPEVSVSIPIREWSPRPK
jgi:hypothetical protein